MLHGPKRRVPFTRDALPVAYYGSYTVDEGKKSIVIKVDGAACSARAGTQRS